MVAQVYAIENNILYQDNKSIFLLAKNGRMSAGKNREHIKNIFFLITDKFSMGDIEIHHKGKNEMWADTNIKPTQGKRFRVMRGHVMRISEDYNVNVERRHTHPLVLLKIESERLSAIYGEVLEKAAIATPKKRPTKKTEKRTNVLFPPQAMPADKRRSVLGEGKYSPGVEPVWKVGSALFFGLLQRPHE